MTGRGTQGLIPGSDLRSVAYDDILCVEMPGDTLLIGYAEDVAAVVWERNVEAVQMRLNQVMRPMN